MISFLPRRKKAARANRARRAAAALAVSAAAFLHPAVPAAQGPDSRLLAAHVLALRAAGVAGGPAAADLIASAPGGRFGETETLKALWRPFFANAVVKLGRLASPRPAALFYDPLLDIALLTLWERRGGGYRAVSARALPGARLEKPAAPATLRPAWMAAADDPAGALARTTAARLDAFARMHPAGAREPGRFATTFAAEAADMRAALPRLAWNAGRRLRWTDGTMPWLRGALTGIDWALASGSAAALKAAAPSTDAPTAAALAGLPAGFAGGLTLDAVLETGGEGRILIASLPEDGDIYLLALCRLDAKEGCSLGRLVLLSVLE